MGIYTIFGTGSLCGHVFARDAGDIDLRDVVHNDRILTVLVPALEMSANEGATLGRLYQSQLAMILSQDLGEKLEGRPQDIMKIRKFMDRFPFLWIIDEVGAGYSEKLGELATQLRSLGYCLLLSGGTTPEISGGRRNLDACRQYGHPHHGEDPGSEGHAGNPATDGGYGVPAGDAGHGAAGGPDGQRLA
ncbi:hypothetical protein [Serratia symbiotica]|uniref:hypothetical protein n=1 Tax=Serratia symbiotica TaxID=138074 RepID=UPI0018D98C48|nr:hypothetical protein [Serratia symbiotica]